MNEISNRQFDFDNKMSTRIDLPISKILIGFEDFNRMVIDVIKDPGLKDEYKENLVSLKKDMMDMELKLRKVINSPSEDKEEIKATPKNTWSGSASSVNVPGSGMGSSPEEFELNPED